MISIAIPLGSGSSMKNMELRYCLRSIEQHLSGVGEVFIIGVLPAFVKNVKHIPLDDDGRTRFRDRNIMLKIAAACNDERVSDDFLMVHDDHFLLAPMAAGAFPLHHHGIMKPGIGQYASTKQNTINLLCGDPHDAIHDYDSHCPILFNKQRFMNTVYKQVDWNKWYGYCMKTLYCVLNGISGTFMEDLKIRLPLKVDEIKEQIRGRPWFSIGDKCFTDNGMSDVLAELYPHPSKYEQ